MYRIRIKKLPTAGNGLSMGDQDGFGLYVAGPGNDFLPRAQDGMGMNYFNQPTAFPFMQVGGSVPAPASNPYGVQQSMQPADMDTANIEAERGETVVGDFDEDGVTEHLAVKGKRHSEGGTPLNVPSGSFIFSDTKKMRIGGNVLQEFGKSGDSKKKYTPAELAKQYDLNKYKAILKNPASDKLEQNTAQMMLDNNQVKLGKLALLQEAMKGFPNGIPGIALPLIQTGMNNPPELEVGALPKAAYGYSDLPVDPYKGDRNAPRPYQQKMHLERGFNEFKAPWLDNYGYYDTPEGLDLALQQLGYKGDSSNAKEVQTFLVNQNLKEGNTGVFKNLLHDYGITNQASSAGVPEDIRKKLLQSGTPSEQDKAMLMKIFADNKFGRRSGELLKALLPNLPPPSKPTVLPIPLGRPNPSIIPMGPPSIVPPAIAPPPDPTPRPIPQGTQPTWQHPPEPPMNWWTQDKINFLGALGNRYNLKKYMPTYVSPAIALPTPTFLDPTRQLAANQEAAAAQNMTAAMFSGAPRLRGVGSSIQGTSATNAANILGQVANQNVAIANQFAPMIAGSVNEKAMQDAAARKTYLDALTTVEQQFDNSKAAANNIARGNLVNAISNAQKTYWLNRVNDQFNVDASTGRMNFMKGKSIGNRSNAGSDTSPAQLYNYHYNEFKNSNAGLEKLDERAHEYAMKRIQNLNKNTPVNMQAALSYLSQMMPQGGGGFQSGYPSGYSAYDTEGD